MPQFPPRRTQPMREESYLRIARLLREIADRVEAAAPALDRHQKAALTANLHGLTRSARAWWQRHQATVNGTLLMPPRDE